MMSVDSPGDPAAVDIVRCSTRQRVQGQRGLQKRRPMIYDFIRVSCMSDRAQAGGKRGVLPEISLRAEFDRYCSKYTVEPIFRNKNLQLSSEKAFSVQSGSLIRLLLFISFVTAPRNGRHSPEVD